MRLLKRLASFPPSSYPPLLTADGVQDGGDVRHGGDPGVGGGTLVGQGGLDDGVPVGPVEIHIHPGLPEGGRNADGLAQRLHLPDEVAGSQQGGVGGQQVLPATTCPSSSATLLSA